MEKIILNFIEVNPETDTAAKYTDGCSGERSDCCTRVCTRGDYGNEQINKLEAWEKFFEVEAGVIQY